MEPKKKIFIVLTGKTASGKDTVKSELFRKYKNLTKVITTTSRSPRHNEKNGVDYFFLTKEEFESKIRNNEFAEYVNYGGNLYGTYKKELEKALDTDLLWKIDPSRAGKVREFIKGAFPENLAEKLINRVLVIYITTDDAVILERLKKRGLSNLEIEKRMKDDKGIWQEYQTQYDFIIENVPGKLNETIGKIINIIVNHNSEQLMRK